MHGSALQSVAKVMADADDLGTLVRPLLELLAQLTGLETTYLTVYDRHDDVQQWRFVHNAGEIAFPEGGAFPWHDTLCARLLGRGDNTIRDLGAEDPDHPAFTQLGIRGYVSIPYSLVGRDGEVAGTLCAGTRATLDLTPEDLQLFDLFAKLFADRLGREVELGRERVRADAAERELHDRASFVAAASHSLKGPLTVIHGWAATLEAHYAELDDERRTEALHRISHNTQRLADGVDGLVDEAHARVLRGALRPRSLDLPGILAAAAADFQVTAPALTIRATGPEGHAYADAAALDLMLDHLLENAVKYVPSGGTVELGATVDGGTAIITVTDDGPGIPEDRDVFEAFTRGDEIALGSGLGLHIVRSLTEASGGTVSAARRPEGGSRFELRLPASA